ncbi:MAG: DUF3667 domain-containing protein [Flavobacteriales bacterium]|nr:DUF3667 domain-containing protein [Flavobacteriales bacterium]
MQGSHQCLNCGHSLNPEDKFCSNCGQEVLAKNESFKDFLHHFAKDYFTFDSKIFKSVSPLLFKPGFLTMEFLKGKRASYIPPLRLYIFVSVVFFLGLNLLGGKSGAGDLNEMDVLIEKYLPRLFFLFLPIFAGILSLLNIRKDRGFIKPLVFSLHFHSFTFLVTLFYLILSKVFGSLSWFAVNQVMLVILALVILFYLVVSIRKAYERGWLNSIVKTTLLLLVYLSCMFTVILLVDFLLVGWETPSQ